MTFLEISNGDYYNTNLMERVYYIDDDRIEVHWVSGEIDPIVGEDAELILRWLALDGLDEEGVTAFEQITNMYLDSFEEDE